MIFFVLEKPGAALGISNLHVYAGMRGESMKDFLKTHNAPGAVYSAVPPQALHKLAAYDT